MILGILLILAGFLIAVFEPLLRIVVAALLIFAGVFFLYLGSYYKRISRSFDDPFIDFFFRM